MKDKADSVDEYLKSLPREQRVALEKLRKVIKDAAPGAEETISYRMPTFKYHGPLCAFAGFKNHLSFFPMSTAVLERYQEELEGFDTIKGTIHFKPDAPLPASLVKNIVKARIEENLQGAGPYRRKPPAGRPRYPIPGYVRRELEERGVMGEYRKRPPYQQNDYIGWIIGAKQEVTRRKRLDQMLEELKRGDVYMKMAYKPKRSRKATS